MKLKSLGKTSILFLVLSFQTTLADDFSASGCQTQSTYNTYNSAQQAECNRLLDRLETANGDPAKMESEIRSFDRHAATAQKAASEAQSATAAERAKRSKDNFCKLSPETAEAAPPEENVQPYGSSGLSECENLSKGNMRKFYSGGSSTRNSAVKWDPYVRYACVSKCASAEEFEACRKTKNEIAKRCESVAYIINSYGRDWDNEDHVRAVNGADGPSAATTQAVANTQNSPNGAAQAIASASTIKCVSAGVETVDYEACRKFKVLLETLDVAQQVGYSAQQLIYQDKMMDSQAKYANEQNTATGALKATGESLKMQQDMYNQRTAVDAAKLAALYSQYNDMPSGNEVADKCTDFIRKDFSSVGIEGVIQLDTCKKAAMSGGGFKLLMNQQQTEAMRSKLIAIATSAGSNLLLASLMGRRAKDVNNAIAKIDDFKPLDPFTVSEEEAQSTFCKMNPGLPQCLGAGLERTFDTMNDNIVTFGEGGTGTNYVGQAIPDATTPGGGSGGGTTRTSVAPVGSVIAAANQDNSMEKVAAAKVTEGGAPAGGGGGGIGGGGLGGGGGGGGAPAGGAPAPSATGTGKTPSYSGGGSFSVVGGFGINKKKSDGKGDDNPFGKLFGKDKPNGAGVVNFRDIASQKVGGKGDNLFDMISTRYQSVNADKRLLEYELAK